MAIAQAKISNSISSIYTSSGTTAITVVFFMNNNASAVTISVAIKTGGGSATIANNGILKEITIAAGDTYILDTEKLVLDNGDAIHAVASINNEVVATIAYVGL
jgi:hypothetical protein